MNMDMFLCLQLYGKQNVIVDVTHMKEQVNHVLVSNEWSGSCVHFCCVLWCNYWLHCIFSCSAYHTKTYWL